MMNTTIEDKKMKRNIPPILSPRQKRVQKKLAEEPNRYLYYTLMMMIILGLMVWSSSSVKLSDDAGSSTGVAWSILGGIAQPDLGFLFDFGPKGVPYLLFETICIAFLGTIIGAVVSLPFALISTKKLVPIPVAWGGRFIVMAIRTIPSLIYGLMFIRVTGQGPFAGVLTMSVVSIGMVTKLYIDTLEDLDLSIVEALSAMGCSRFQQVRYGILPQLYANFASIVIYRFDMNLRDAAVLGLVGAGGIGAPLLFGMQGNRWNEVGSILWGLVILVMAIEIFSTHLRRKLAHG